jgi:uncharacterized protein (DUF1015 family)
MPKIRPFAGIRFDETIAGPLGAVTAPPYDVISKQDEGQLRARSSYNIVHVDLPDEAASAQRYVDAGRRFDSWLREGVLKEDQERSLYVLEESFECDGSPASIVGVLASVRLEPLGGAILPHEQTLLGPREDRLALMRATAAALSPVYGIYSEKTGAVQATLDSVMSRPPVGEATGGDGVRYRLYRTTDPGEIARLVAVLDGVRTVIADGHHRYETALAYRDERRRLEASEGRVPTGDEDYDHTLMFLVNVEGASFTVLPVHRVMKVPGFLNVPDLFAALEPYFHIEPFSRLSNDALFERMRAQKTPTMATYLGRHEPFYLLRLKAHVDVDAAVGGAHSSAWNHLDVSLLHRLVIESALRIDADDVAGERHVGFVKDPAEAMRLVDTRAFDLAFFLNPIPVEQVLQIAAGGETLPQKSTYFWPKPLTGLLIEGLG